MLKSWFIKTVKTIGKGIRNFLVKVFCSLIRFYQVFLSPLFPGCCRFTPTCSNYALEAFRKHGPFKGFYLTFKRILRCNPYNEGGYDPVPD